MVSRHSFCFGPVSNYSAPIIDDPFPYQCMSQPLGYQDGSFENTVVNVHWRLVRNVTRSDGLREWQRMAVKVKL